MSRYEERLADLATSAVTAAAWNPALHPRARNGQFIRVGSWVRGVFSVGGSKERLNGKVTAVEENKLAPRDPIVKVMTKHGVLKTTASQIQEATKPKGFISKVLTGDEQAKRLAQYQQKMSTLEGDITFESNLPLENAVLNGVPLSEVDFDPHTIPDKDVGEPDLGQLPGGMKQSAGVLIEEPDGRIWIYEPANHFGGYKSTFSKGRIDEGDTAQQAALREAFEELGLVAEITGFVGDYRGSTTMTRLYRGKRIGGAPWKHDDEVAEVRLVSPDTAAAQLHAERDIQILSDLTGNQSYIEPFIKERERKAAERAAWEAKKKSQPEKSKDDWVTQGEWVKAKDGSWSKPKKQTATSQSMADKWGKGLAGSFDPTLHPRGKDGRFIEVGGFVRGLFKFAGVGNTQEVSRAQVTNIYPNHRDPNDPIVEIHSKGEGFGRAPASALMTTAAPLGYLSKDESVEQIKVKALAVAVERADRYVDRLVERQRSEAERLRKLSSEELVNESGALATAIWRQQRGYTLQKSEQLMLDSASDNPEAVKRAVAVLRRRWRKIERQNGEPNPWFVKVVEDSVSVARANPKIAQLEKRFGVPELTVKVVNNDPAYTPTANYNDTDHVISYFGGVGVSISASWAGDEDSLDHSATENDAPTASTVGGTTGPSIYRHEFGHHVERMMSPDEALRDDRMFAFRAAWSKNNHQYKAEMQRINEAAPGIMGFEERQAVHDTLISYYAMQNWREGWAETFSLITHPAWVGSPEQMADYSPEAQELIRLATDILENPA